MTKRICDRCGYAYEAKCTSPNIIYLCPICLNYVGCECEYGFGPIVPCSILLGGKQIAEIVYNDSNGYRLISSELGIDKDLIKGYEQLGAYDETVEIIAEQIKAQGFKVKEEHVDINIETGEPFTREQIIEIVKRIKACKYASEAEADRDIMLLEKGVLDPNISDYIFWDELTPEEIADKALSYKPIQL